MNQTITHERIRLATTRRGGSSALSVIVTFLSLASLLLLLQTVKVATSGYDLQQLEQVREDWKQKNYQLQAEISSLQSLARVEKEAKARLKMVPATQYFYVTVALAPEANTVGPDSAAAPSGTEKSETSSLLGWWQQLVQSWKTTLRLPQ